MRLSVVDLKESLRQLLVSLGAKWLCQLVERVSLHGSFAQDL